MTSPYLQRPKRSLHQALIDTGRAPQDLGLEDTHTASGMRYLWPKGLARISRNHIAVALVLGSVLIAGTTLVALQSSNEPPIAKEAAPDAVPGAGDEIVPAAGLEGGADPDQPAADIQNWGDAPSLEAPGGSNAQNN